ncbi:FixH family protein [Kyrpidia tusciae]|uniref:YtkA-like domain-containing protein n=1 Tax=Kyrpidia tusciae (strain DSM 2912 / NBRC 15312 / T2) TaxID=562970 RepID=D5WU06_KYRT2|nr:FixH family protein [Kyrpidia tusciae]ADG05326.1 hypothetical protein Btus_0561 [Kyrpidia tusciae DSM 2912]MBE3551468.1 FixH family protein [Kyrpidia tusciae]
MQRRWVWTGVSLSVAAGLLAGCGQTAAPSHTDQSQGNPGTSASSTDMTMDSGMNMDQQFDIAFSTDPPGPVKANQPVKLIEKVSKKGTPISGAYIKLEIWKDGDSKHEMVDVVEGPSGTYTVEKTFDKPGLYHVTLHTTALGFHEMPTKNIEVQ